MYRLLSGSSTRPGLYRAQQNTRIGGMVADSARAFWVAAPGQGEIRSEPLRSPTADDVVVRALYSGISRGTEALVFQGRVPVSEYQRMRAPFQAGEFPGPVKYGYASVGQIERGPGELLGKAVFALYPHQTRYVVPAQSAHVLPADVPPQRAVLTASLETAINGLWDAAPHIGDRIVVIGAGTVGCLVAWLAGRIAGCEVELVDVNPQRSGVARVLGVRFAAPQSVSEGADVVLHASGSPAGLDLALRIAGFEATVVEMSWYGDRVVPLALGEGFHARRLTLTSSQVGSVAGAQRARWDTRRRMQLALSLLADPLLDALITGESEFDALPGVMAALAAAPGETLCHRIRY
jgi:2-desacetyl-2-hydroxyethyl bacteriochlorophyllide A dehydrogenase